MLLTASWIALLASGEPEVRRKAALELYAAGRALGDSVQHAWLAADAELAGLFFEHVLDTAQLALQARPRKVVVGLAVRPESFEKIRAANGAPPLAEVPADQDALEFELHLGAAELDILTTRAPGSSGAMARFLEKFGEGVQQVEYFVGDVERATALLRERCGVQPLYPQTRAGADCTRVNFFLVANPEGTKVLIELVEEAA